MGNPRFQQARRRTTRACPTAALVPSHTLFLPGQRWLLLLVIVIIGVGVAFISKVFVAVETNIPADVNADKEVIARHIGGENEILVDLLAAFRQVGFFEFTISNECCVVYGGC